MTAVLPPPVVAAEPADEVPVPVERRRVPWLLLLPGLLWLAVFFAVPLVTLVSTSLQTGSLQEGYRLTFTWSTYRDVWSTYGD